MTNEIILAVISAVIGAIITLCTTLILERRKEKREDALQAKKLQSEAFQNRPEMQVIDFKDYISRTGYGVKQKADIELLVLPIQNVTIEGEKKRAVVNAHYDETLLNADEWCCVIYTLRNTGKTDISNVDIVWNHQRSACLFPIHSARQYTEGQLLNYSYCYDKKTRVNESITLKVCYHKESIVGGTFSAAMSIGMIDDNGLHWTQPLFAPENKVYDSRLILPKEYMDRIRTDLAEKCFKDPLLW